jgi:hypothetical protein
MAAEQLQIEIKADVQNAVSSLKEVQSQLANTGKAADSTSTALPKFSDSTNKAAFALQNFGRVAADAPFGLVGIGNNIAPLLESFASLRASAAATGTTIRASLLAAITGPAGLIVGVQLITSALTFWQLSQRGANKEAESGSKSAARLADELDRVRDLSNQIAQSLGQEAAKVSALVFALDNNVIARVKQKDAIQELINIAPQYFKNLDREKFSIDALNQSYSKYIDSLVNQQIAQVGFKQVEKEFAKIIDLQNQLNLANVFSGLGVGDNSDIADIQKRIEFIKKQIKQTFDNIRKLVGDSGFLQATGIDKFGQGVSNSNKEVGKLYDAFKGVEIGIFNSNKALLEQAQLQRDLNRLVVESERLRTGGLKPVSDGLDSKVSPQKSPIQQLDALAGEFIKVNEQAKLVSDTINNGINQGIDTFFNALANNQDPFKALVQSVQRLVVELGAAVVKALVLKAITTAINPGVGLAIGGLQSAGSNILRSDLLRLAITR